MKKDKVCYILSYKAPNYVRTTSLVNALLLLDDVVLFQARNKSKGFLRYFETFFQFIKIRLLENPDVYVIGFRGHEIYWLYRIFALRKTFIFDEMMSPYDSLVNEKKVLNKNNLLAKIMYFLEKSILENSNTILTDTKLHLTLISETFGVSRNKIIVIPVGTDEDLFKTAKVKKLDVGEEFTVFFYATFLPLHGVDIILKSAKLLEKHPIKFIIIGGKGNKKGLLDFKNEVNHLGLKNIEHYEWVDFDKLPRYIKSVDLCLGGPFGNTGQAKRVVTGKTYQFLYMGKATVIGKIKENTGFIDKKNSLLVEQGNSKALADAILWGYKNKEKLDDIGKNGHNLFMEEFSYNRLKNKFNIKKYE